MAKTTDILCLKKCETEEAMTHENPGKARSVPESGKWERRWRNGVAESGRGLCFATATRSCRLIDNRRGGDGNFLLIHDRVPSYFGRGQQNNC